MPPSGRILVASSDDIGRGARRPGPALESIQGFVLWLVPTVEKFPRATDRTTARVAFATEGPDSGLQAPSGLPRRRGGAEQTCRGRRASLVVGVSIRFQGRAPVAPSPSPPPSASSERGPGWPGVGR